ncbi:MAG: hypothetical protein ABI728_14400 [Betaproteobacteria bacterium]
MSRASASGKHKWGQSVIDNLRQQRLLGRLRPDRNPQAGEGGQREIALSLTPIMDPLWRIIGLGRAKEVALTGRTYIGSEDNHQRIDALQAQLAAARKK